MKVISIDFWNTLVDGKVGFKERHQARIQKVKQLVNKYDSTISVEQIEASLKQVSAEFDVEWLGNKRTMSSKELVERILILLSVSAKKSEKEELTFAFHHSLLMGPPQLAPGVLEWIPQLAAKFPLAVISDTMFSPGLVLRSYLQTHHLLDYFSYFVFSDETGYSKPDERAFNQVLEKLNGTASESIHIGDIQSTDIIGAQAIGMKAVLYTGLSKADAEETTADFIANSWASAAHYCLKN